MIWEDPAATEALRGREAVYRFHQDTMFRSLPDVRVELLEGPYFSSDGASVAVRLRISGTMTGPLEPPGFSPTGRDSRAERVGIWLQRLGAWRSRRRQRTASAT